MLTKRPTSFLLTPQYRVDALCVEWHRSRGQGRSASSRSRPRGAPATSADLHGLEGLLRKPDPRMTLSLPEDAELIDQLHKLTGKMPKFAQFNPPPATPTPAPSPSPQRMEAKAARSRSVTNAEPPAATPILAFCDLTSGRRRKHALAGKATSP
jgi:hypothetical protein